MPDEPATEGVPPVPGVWRLGWLLFMQPIVLHRLYQAWGIKGDPSLIRVWRLARTGNPVVRALMAKYALLLFVIMPLTAVLVAAAPTLSGITVRSEDVVFGVALSVAFGVAFGVVFGATFGVVFGVTFGVALSVTLDLAGGMAPDVTGGLSGGVAIGVTVGVARGMSRSVSRSVSEGVAFSASRSMAKGVGIGLGIGVVEGVIRGVAFGVVIGVSLSVAECVTFLRIPIWLVEAFLTQLLAWRMRRRPDAVRRLASRIPFRHDDLIYLPLPGLRACLLQVAEADPALGKELIAQAAASIGQRRIARRALIELQARDLERAARDKLFTRAADLDLPFLPKEPTLASQPANAPLAPFRTAARDLVAGSTNHRQRRLALEHARTSLEDLRTSTVGTRNPDTLATRLLHTTAVWLDVIQLEADKLTREAADHPEVPSAFIAGPPLTPDRAADRTLFKGRTDIIKLIGHDLAPDRRGVLLVVGQRRMGKTSLCNYLPTYLGSGTLIVVSNFQPLSGDPHRETPHRRVLGDIAARLTEAPPPPASDRWGEDLRWLEELDRTCADRKIVVVIDEVERVEDGIRAGWCSTDFLDFLRAAGDALRNIRFLLLTAYPLHRLGPHWTDRLVSVTSRTISYLGEDDARELLSQPIPEFPDIYPAGGVELILAQTGRHPYLLQKAGDDLCRLLNSRGGLRTATIDELTEVFDGMVRDVQVFDEIWRSRTEDEQATLLRLARSDEPADRDVVTNQLEREGYLERRGDKVAFIVPLFREWIRMKFL